jgi:predicted GIY-YIG superfamily endonuclease/predicted DNA-binding transcriptional regulator AlpA
MGWNRLNWRQTALYKLHDWDGNFLYVGVAVNPKKRWVQHSREKLWWPEVDHKATVVEWFRQRQDAEEEELRIIASGAAKYNIAGAPDSARVPQRKPSACECGSSHLATSAAPQRQNNENSLPHLMGQIEIQKRLNYSRQWTHSVVKSKGFPDPAYKLAIGRVWLAEDIERWIAENRPDPEPVDQ